MPQCRTRKDRLLSWSLLALLLLVPVTVSAADIPSTEYYQNLEDAITALDTLQSSDEEEAASAYEERFDQTIKDVGEALPEHQSVQTKEGVCNVDNSWLHEALKDLKTASAEQREAKLAQIIDRLEALEDRVAPAQADVAAGSDKAQTKQKLESILSRPEYASKSKGQSAFNRLFEAFFRWLQQFIPKGIRIQPHDSPWMKLVAQVLVVLVAAVVLFYVVRLLLAKYKPKRQQRASKKREPRIVLGERLEPEDTAVDLLAEAEALARSGDVRAAIRKAYIALLVELGDRKLIALAQHKTNRDYLNAVRSLQPLHQTMRGLTDSFERHWYGVAEATDNDWQNFRSGYRSAVQTQN